MTARKRAPMASPNSFAQHYADPYHSQKMARKMRGKGRSKKKEELGGPLWDTGNRLQQHHRRSNPIDDQ